MTRRRLHPVGDAQRLRILKRDNYTCQYCFEGATEIDHIIPYSYIPDNRDLNLVASCGECNRIAHNMVFDSFLEKYMFIKRRRQQRGNRRHSPVIVPTIDEATTPKVKAVKPKKTKVAKPPKIKPKDTYDPSQHIRFFSRTAAIVKEGNDWVLYRGGQGRVGKLDLEHPENIKILASIGLYMQSTEG